MSSAARLSHYEYERSKTLALGDPPFYSLVAAAMRRADTENLGLLRAAFPGVYEDLNARYNAPGGRLPNDKPRPA